MSQDLRNRLYNELNTIRLIDPHTHIPAESPASQSLADILGYHYYTELAHSAGLPREGIEEPGIEPKEKVRRVLSQWPALSNTIQGSWFLEILRELLGWDQPAIRPDDWETLWDLAHRQMTADNWAQRVIDRSKLDAVFLTNDFDDRLEGFDTQFYIPCLRTDELVFHLARPEVRERLQAASGHALVDVRSLRECLGSLFTHFCSKNARACAISLPPDFAPIPVSENRAETALADLLRHGVEASDIQKRAVAHYVFWTLAEYCAEFRLPFDLMIGVHRRVYPSGVYQGQDLYDSRVSLIQYATLFNAFPQVRFPISVLASVTNQELTSYAWIFPNVLTSGHWWYSNTPTFIEHDASARLEAVPRTKQIGYYSDMYKLEFALPKFNMYKRILAKILAERFVVDRGWSEDEALALGHDVLRGNIERVFGFGGDA